MIKELAEEYKLLPLNEEHIHTLYEWGIEEKHFEYYTCRPLKSCESFERYTFGMLNGIYEGKQKIYVLVKKDDENTPVGKITLFDLNPRNHSGEFGYYLPYNNRGNGLGNIMLAKFMEVCFNDESLDLNKIYATTSSNNIPSIRLLERFGFELDGRLREHYWIDENRYDQLIYSTLKCEWSK